MVALLRQALRRLDRHPSSYVLGLVGGGTLFAYLLVAHLSKGHVLLGRIDPGARRELYGSLAGTSGTLLGFVITSLSVLLALPRRDSSERLRKMRAWPLLNHALLLAAGLLAIVLVLATVALAVDDTKHGTLWLEVPVTTLSLVGFAELLLGGAAFAMVISETSRS